MKKCIKKQISNIDNKINTELEKIEKAEEEVTSETIGIIDVEVHDDDSK